MLKEPIVGLEVSVRSCSSLPWRVFALRGGVESDIFCNLSFLVCREQSKPCMGCGDGLVKPAGRHSKLHSIVLLTASRFLGSGSTAIVRVNKLWLEAGGNCCLLVFWCDRVVCSGSSGSLWHWRWHAWKSSSLPVGSQIQSIFTRAPRSSISANRWTESAPAETIAAFYSKTDLPACWGSRGFLRRDTALPNVQLVTISSGRGHVCGLKEDGMPVCWGAGSYGQTTPPKERRFAAINGGGFHTCALREDGAPFCWGQNDRGQASPPAGERLIAIASGIFHTCGLRPNGEPVCWGFDNSGQASPPEGKRFVSVSAGVASTCGLQADGIAVCWGADLANAAPPRGKRFTLIRMGEEHGCGLRADGVTLCWGPEWSGEAPMPEPGRQVSMESGQSLFCVLGSNAGVFCPGGATSIGELVPDSERFTEIASGSLHSCGLREEEILVCWGLDDYGQASLARQIGVPPTPPPRPTQKFAAISAGSDYTCGLTAEEGAPLCWGDNRKGRATPPRGEQFTTIASGGDHTCALRADGSAVCWGHDQFGQASPPKDKRFISISAGEIFTCGIQVDHVLTCWGESDFTVWESMVSVSSHSFHFCGLRPDGTAACWGQDVEGHTRPPMRTTFKSISTGNTHTCALEEDGTPVCWGDAGPERVTSPPRGELLTSLSSGVGYVCGLRQDGSAVCWGRNRSGQSSPPDGQFVAVSSGSSHTCGLRENGIAACWGFNEDGQASPP